jgi:putative transcriptional regulator
LNNLVNYIMASATHHRKNPFQPQWLTGNLLIAMPTMEDPRFTRSVILICSHNEDGAMGIVINKLFGALNFSALMEQLEMEASLPAPDIDVHSGGPVEPGRGFVLHSLDYTAETTGRVTPEIGLTSTIDILRDMAKLEGPAQALLALGYAAWSGGQLEAELQQNGWLVLPAKSELVFDRALESKWERALAGLGITPALFSGEAGRA